MGLNNYNDSEDKFSETLKALKELPKVNAPDDFEFNLMIKITNGEFDSGAEEKRQSRWLWILAPAAFVMTSVILFITLTQNDVDRQLNPLQNQGSIYTGKTGDTALKNRGNAIIPSKPVQKRDFRASTQISPQNQQNYTAENAAPIPEYLYNPFAPPPSFKFDNLLKKKQGDLLTRNQTAEYGYGLPDEMLLNEGNSQKTLKERKAVIDSLKKMVSKNDTVKMKKNIKR